MESEFWKTHWETSSLLASTDPFIQVARTKNKTPISEEEWTKTLAFIEENLLPASGDRIIDLCCGNGLLSKQFAPKVRQLIAVDFSEKLIDSFIAKEFKNLTLLCEDVNKLVFDDLKFNKVLFQFAAQHFTEQEILRILEKVSNSIDPGGLVYIGDVPDIDRRWDFYFKPSYQNAYFSRMIEGKPIVGTWYKKDFFEFAAEHFGFDCKIIDQPDFMLNSNHRFDVLLTC